MDTRTSQSTTGTVEQDRPANRTVRWLRTGMEGLVLALVCLSPWALGGAGPLFELILYSGVSVLLLLWALSSLLEGRLTWLHSGVALCLAGLFLEGMWQLTPLEPNLLARVAPGTARLYQELLPATPEVLPFGEARDPVIEAGRTISLYPAATRARVIRLPAIFVIFFVVFNSLSSPETLWRFSVVVFITGVLLSLFSVVHFFTARQGMVYWVFPTQGQLFGPFVNRNHFAFYVNVSIGLGLGLLLRQSESGRYRSGFLSNLLQTPLSLWLGLALALLIGAVLFSASRGGPLALVAGLTVLVVLGVLGKAGFAGSSAGTWLAPLVLVVGGSLALVAWFGLAPLQARWQTLGWGEPESQSRLDLWADQAKAALDFPLWGTGYGTFQFVEPMYRSSVQDVLFEHAENDYLEWLIEGGTPALLIIVLAIVLVYRQGLRALGSRSAPLALGGLVGFTAVVAHSCVDFGLHMPAVALLVAVLCAHLCAAGRRSETAATQLRLGGLAPLAGVVGAVAVGLVLCAEGWRAFRAERLRGGAFGVIASKEKQLAQYAAAARLSPASAYIRLELGHVCAGLFEEQKQQLEEGRLLTETCQVFLVGASPTPAAISGWMATMGYRQYLVNEKVDRLARRHLVSGLRQYLAARDLCPLIPESHLRISASARLYEKADPATMYRERARRLAPADPELWFLCGARDLADGRLEQAWQVWRHSLELSGRNLGPILELSGEILKPQEILDQVLPERADLILQAVNRFHPNPDAIELRRPFLERALEVLARQKTLSAEDVHARAAALRDLGQTQEAIKAYRGALPRRPREAGWRYELAALLYQERELQESRRELLTVVTQQPENEEARALLEAVNRELAEKKARR